ncbi:MAG: transcriptional repressor [Desulfobulbus sp.]|jgi:Fe2+ or Zn2+ uptake regulation protein|nr:transcriptional repressor [Desulfobulbus sp.]
MHRTLRMTHQREVVLHELQRCQNHPTADELYGRIKKKLPRISLATVYRNLEILAEAGLISKLEVSGRQKRFDWDPTVHAHVSCVCCHRVDNLDSSSLPCPRVKPEQQQGYEITGCRIEFFGVCPTCRQQKGQNPSEGESVMGPAASAPVALNDQQRQVLEALAKSTAPSGSKELAAATGLGSKQVSCQLTALKNKGCIASPMRCKYEITDQGRILLDR